MKLFFRTLLVVAVILCAGQTASAQSLKDMFKKAAETVEGSGLGDVINQATEAAGEAAEENGLGDLTNLIEQVTGIKLSKADIKGTWNYAGSAVKFESADFIKTAAAGVAATQVEEKLDEYLAKVGLMTGSFSFTFNADNTFSTKVKGKEFKGTYTLSEDGRTLELKYGRFLNAGGFTATASISNSTFLILFKADRLLELIGKLTTGSSNATIQAIGAIAAQYDGMKIGLELQR